jgi:hypothetical protein
MSFFDDYKPQEATRITPVRSGKNFYERLAEEYRDQAALLSGEEVFNRNGKTKKTMFACTSDIVRCSPKVATVEPLFGRTGNGRSKVIELSSKDEAAKMFLQLADAIDKGDAEIITIIDAARENLKSKRNEKQAH